MSQQINLYNPIFLKQKKIFSAVTMVQALGAILIGAVAFAVFAQYQVAHLEAEVKRSEARAGVEEARLARLTTDFAARKQSVALESEVKRSEHELKTREEIVALLESGAVGESGGVSPYLRALARQNLNGLWLTGFELMGKDMILSGRALRADLLPEYLRRLGREDAMRGRQFAMLHMQEPKPPAADKGAAPRFIEFALRSVPPKESK